MGLVCFVLLSPRKETGSLRTQQNGIPPTHVHFVVYVFLVVRPVKKVTGLTVY
jgi:hypothetical protein